MALDTIQIVRGIKYLGQDMEIRESIVDAESMPNLDVILLGETANQLVAMTLDVSQLKGSVMHCDQAVTIKTNDAVAPDDTITLAAGQCRIWSAADEATWGLFTVDVTGFYVAVVGTTAPRLRCWFPLDPTVEE